MGKLKKAICLILVIVIAFSGIAASKPAKTYDKAQKEMTKGAYEKAAELFESISSYEDASQQAMYCKALAFGEKGQYEDAVKALKFLGNFKDSAYLLTYYTICRQAFSDNASILDLLEAAEKFDEISIFRDSAKKAEECRQRVYNIALDCYNEGNYDVAAYIFDSLEDYQDSTEQVNISLETAKEKQYQDAITLMQTGNYTEAISAFEELKGYKDSAAQIGACKTAIKEGHYQHAIVLMQSGAYTQAITALEKVKDYKDSATQIEACKKAIKEEQYQDAITLMQAEKYSEAISSFEELKDYKDSSAQIEACKKAIKEEQYQDAITLMEAGKYTEAISSFEELRDYNDSAAQIEACQTAIKEEQYQQAIALNATGQYDEAYERFAMLSGYKDVDTIIQSDKNIRNANYQVGHIVKFGYYEQNNNSSDGKETIEWQVLAREDNKVLLISRYALDCQQYNTSKTDITWEKCTLRSWLNGTFLNTAFSADEQKQILSSRVTADKNPNYSSNPGNDTTDKVFLLSINEVNQYFTSDSARQCTPTAYAKANGCYVNGRRETCWWWLRLPGIDGRNAAGVAPGGTIDAYGLSVNKVSDAVRPALWINLDS